MKKLLQSLTVEKKKKNNQRHIGNWETQKQKLICIINISKTFLVFTTWWITNATWPLKTVYTILYLIEFPVLFEKNDQK